MIQDEHFVPNGYFLCPYCLNVIGNNRYHEHMFQELKDLTPEMFASKKKFIETFCKIMETK